MPISANAMTASMAITMIIGIMPYSSSGVKVRQQGMSGRYHRAEGGGNSWARLWARLLRRRSFHSPSASLTAGSDTEDTEFGFYGVFFRDLRVSVALILRIAHYP